MCSILIKKQADRDLLREKLAAEGIETRPSFTGPNHADVPAGWTFPVPVANKPQRPGHDLPSYRRYRDDVRFISSRVLALTR
jgi:hypothetical protein